MDRLPSDLMDHLPAELHQTILSYLSIQELLQVQWVSHHWQQQVRAVLAHRTQLDLAEEFVSHRRGREKVAVTEDQLRDLLDLVPQLREFACSTSRVYFSRVTRLDMLAQLCPRLVSVCLTCSGLSPDAVWNLCRACGQTLESLILPVDFRLGDRLKLPSLLPLLPRLRILSAHNVCITADALPLLPETLESLTVHGFMCTWRGDLRGLARCGRLRELHLWGRSKLMSADVVAALTTLQRLSTSCLEAPQKPYVPEAGASQLRHLKLHGLDGVTDSTLELLPRFAPGLHSLSLDWCRSVTERGLISVAQLPELYALNLSDVITVTEEALHRLCSLPLRQLHIRSNCLLVRGAIVPFWVLTRTLFTCTTLELLCVDETFWGNDWASLGDRLSSVRDVIVCFPVHGPVRLRQWAEGSTETVRRDLKHAVQTGRYEDWFLGKLKKQWA